MADYVIKTLSVTLNNGSKKQIKIYGKTEEEATEKRNKKKWEYDNGLLVLNSNTLFRQWANEWLIYYKKPDVSNKTYKDIEGRINKHFMPTLGNMKMCDIRSIHIKKCYDKLEGKSISLQNKCRSEINNLFVTALINDLINKNPCVGVKMPYGTEDGRRSLTPEEKEIFFKTLDTNVECYDNNKHPFGNFFAIMIGCGLRPGEVRALTWANIDMIKKNINVINAVEPDTINVKDTKTKAGHRTIPIPNWLYDRLKSMQHNDLSFVFKGANGKPITEKRYERAWDSFNRLMDINAGAKLYRNKVIIHAIDQDITPYYLRHTYATGLVEADVNIKTAQYLLGHKDIKMTLKIYSHVTDKMLDDARNKINYTPDKKVKKLRIKR